MDFNHQVAPREIDSIRINEPELKAFTVGNDEGWSSQIFLKPPDGTGTFHPYVGTVIERCHLLRHLSRPRVCVECNDLGIGESTGKPYCEVPLRRANIDDLLGWVGLVPVNTTIDGGM
jgi:hypothetical protein